MTRFTATLSKLKEEGRFRALSPAKGIDLTSNDYLGLKSHHVLRETAIAALDNGLDIGSGGSRLLRGNHPAHEALEHNAAAFFGCEQTLFFANGFSANHALMTALPATHDVILFDALIHASLRDGIQSNPAKHIRIPHNDVNAFEDALKQHSGKLCWVVVESVYSMDGDMAPLTALHKLCEKHNAMLVVDEAHATAVFGEQGKGLTHKLHSPNLISLHTCGKGLGVAGALVCASRDIIETLINKARSFIYSTAPMPLQAVLVNKALELCAAADDRRARLFALCEMAKQFLPLSPSPIFPVILGDEPRAMNAAAALQSKGFDIRAIRPPTVPAGSSRLRITLNANLRDEDIKSLGHAMQDIL
ncbi:MAG: 8-amino-7-oxononanoate synthase [Alphaproteobacteria bacterium]|nr:8-amino-7-oxononanoate synthase [Alphaproteobacteria bacterium]